MGTKSKSFALVIVALFLTSLVVVSPATVKAQSKTIIVPDDYSDVQTAINNANDGDMVFVKKGTYHTWAVEGLYINKSISLMGENSQYTVLTRYPVEYIHFAHATVSIMADNVVVSGFTINGSSIGIIVYGSHDVIKGNNLVNYDTGIYTNNYYSGFPLNHPKYGSDTLILANNITGNSSHGIYQTSPNSRIIANNITQNGVGIIIDSTKNVTIMNNKIINNAKGLSLRWDGPFYISNNDISDNSGYGVEFGSNCSYSIVNNNLISRNAVGVKLIEVGENPFGESLVGLGNQFYYNNLIDNDKNVDIATSGKTDVVSWDNGIVGNYWSDYHGQGAYIIDQNNVDFHPLTQQIDITTTAPTLLFHILMIAVISIVATLLVGVSLLLYNRHRKILSQNKPNI